MKIAVWKTGHKIADTVASAIYAGFCRSDCNAFPPLDTHLHLDMVNSFDCHIGYGILRGMDDVFRACKKSGKTYFNIDRGYWKPGHYDGYYRVSLCGTQQTTFNGLEPDYARLDNLGIDILRGESRRQGRKTLVCPPTDYVESFFGKWKPHITGDILVRPKGCDLPLQHDLDQCNKVITFNSSVGWEALRQGIEVISDPDHSIIGAYQKSLDKPLHLDLHERHRLFGIQCALQLTLDEARQGMLWPLLQKLLGSSSVLTVAKQSPQTWQRIASNGAHNQT